MDVETIVTPRPAKLSDLAAGNGYQFASGIIAQHPDAAAQVATTISHMAAVDQAIDSMVIVALAADGRAIAKMLKELPISNQREKVVKSLIKENVDDELRETWSALSPRINKVREIRNRFSHWIWGKSGSLPEHLLLAPIGAVNAPFGAAHEFKHATATGTVGSGFITSR